MLGLGSLPMLAQTPQTDLPQLYSLVDGKTIIKTDPFNDILGHLNLKVERLITRGASAQLSSSSPLTGLRRSSQVLSTPIPFS